LSGGDKNGRDDQDDKRGLVMEPEDIVVNADGLELDQPLDRAEHVKHGGRFSIHYFISSSAISYHFDEVKH